MRAREARVAQNRDGATPCCICGEPTRVVSVKEGRELVACDGCECEYYVQRQGKEVAG